jgi:hypothetical protein
MMYEVKCIVCGRDLPYDMTQLSHVISACMKHEGSDELRIAVAKKFYPEIFEEVDGLKQDKARLVEYVKEQGLCEFYTIAYQDNNYDCSTCKRTHICTRYKLLQEVSDR